MIRNQLFIGAALIVGVAIGYIMKPDTPVDGADDAGYVTASKIGDTGDAASIRALRARIDELEKQLAARDGGQPVEVAEAKPPADEKDAKERPRSPMRDMREHMEWLKKEKPEEYAKLTEAMARWRQQRIDRTHSKLDLLASVDTSTMTDEQKAAHEKFQDLLVRREELVEKMQNPEMSDEDREDIMRDMHNTGWAMRETAKVERETLIAQEIKALGYSGDDAAEVSAAFNEILSVTEVRGGPGGGPGPGGPPPGNMPNAK